MLHQQPGETCNGDKLLPKHKQQGEQRHSWDKYDKRNNGKNREANQLVKTPTSFPTVTAYQRPAESDCAATGIAEMDGIVVTSTVEVSLTGQGVSSLMVPAATKVRRKIKVEIMKYILFATVAVPSTATTEVDMAGVSLTTVPSATKVRRKIRVEIKYILFVAQALEGAATAAKGEKLGDITSERTKMSSTLDHTIGDF